MAPLTRGLSTTEQDYSLSRLSRRSQHAGLQSFSAYVRQSIRKDTARNLNKKEEVEALSPGYERLVHGASLQGIAFQQSFFMLLVLVCLRSLEWTTPNLDGVPVLNPWLPFWLWLPFWSFFALAIWAHKSQKAEWKNCGPKYAQWTLLAGMVIVALTSGIIAGYTWAGVDGKHTGLDLLILFVFFPAFLLLDEVGRSKWYARDKLKGIIKIPTACSFKETTKISPGLVVRRTDAPSSRRSKPPMTKTDARAKHHRNDSVRKVMVSLIPVLSAFSIGLLYPSLVIPAFFGGTTLTRILICLLLHPLLLEAAEALGRSTKGETTASELRSGEITLEQAKKRIVQGANTGYIMKQLMSFYRRLMLLNMGSPVVTIAAVVGASIEEAVERGFLVEIDSALRRWRGRSKLCGNDLKLQRLVWMCDANQSAVAELNAIIVSSFAQILLVDHQLILALGYEVETPLNIPAVFVQLCVELVLELVVDNVVMWAEGEHSIPVTRYFALVRTRKVFLFQTAVAVLTLCFSLYSFLRHPSILSADSSNVCEHLDRPEYAEWFAGPCSNNLTQAYSVREDQESTLFDEVDPLMILVALITGIVMLAFISLSVLLARYHRTTQDLALTRSDKEKLSRQKDNIAQSRDNARKEVALVKRENRQLKRSLEAAQKHVDRIMGEEGGTVLDSLVRKIAHADLNFHESVGEGSFGTVWHAEWIPRSGSTTRAKRVAVKTVRVSKVSEDTLKSFKSEISVMAPLHHPNLVNMHGACWTDGPDKLCIVLEFCEKGSVADLLKSGKHTWFSTYSKIALGIAECFKYLHHDLPSGQPLIHRKYTCDLKPANVLVADDMSAKVADFGESTIFDTKKAHLEGDIFGVNQAVLTLTMVGTPMYCAVYSFAVLLLELAVGSSTFILHQFVSVVLKLDISNAREKQGFVPSDADEKVAAEASGDTAVNKIIEELKAKLALADAEVARYAQLLQSNRE